VETSGVFFFLIENLPKTHYIGFKRAQPALQNFLGAATDIIMPMRKTQVEIFLRFEFRHKTFVYSSRNFISNGSTTFLEKQ